ncbi:MAG: hypothetical protein GXO49_08030 [Chlorobi bacterium]|nr:hypothetical protein [Chlorobiota bacterium]
MLYASVDKSQLYSGIIAEKGIWGLWILWVSMISVAVVPLVFAPLWAKLNFITDNQFILFRFSGQGARILHQFRAVYVGGLVVSFILSFQTIAFSRILQVYYNISLEKSILITGGLLSLFSLKNSFANKFKNDIFHSILYFLSLGISFYFLYKNSGGLTHAINQIKINSPNTLFVLPPKDNTSLWYSLFVYLGIQWWSSSTFDGGGPEMSRYTATGTRLGAIKTGLAHLILELPVIGILIIMSLLSFAKSNFANNGELEFVKSVFETTPKSFSTIILLGFFALFITSSESILNWGASFLTVDFYKKHLVKNKTEKHYIFISFLSMLVLSFLSMIIALYINSLDLLIKIIFSISAGVAPVFILRWFWMRINAWSQISAMISSGIYTLLFFVFEYYNPSFFNDLTLQGHEWRIIIVTILTSITWIIITFFTKKDDKETINKFFKILPPKHEIIKSFILALLIGISIILFLGVSTYLIYNCVF